MSDDQQIVLLSKDDATCAVELPKDEVENTNRQDKGVKRKQEIEHGSTDLRKDKNNKKTVVENLKFGFDRGLEPDHIFAVIEKDGQLMFYMVWKNSRKIDLIDAAVVYKKCPQLAIQFFETNYKLCIENEKKSFLIPIHT